MSASPRFAFEDFEVGSTIETSSRVISRDDIRDFAADYDPQPFHLDEDAARAAGFPDMIASGWHTCAFAMRLMCDDFLNDSTSMGSPGLEVVNWMKPVFPGDALRARMEVLEKRLSSSKPDRGFVLIRIAVVNQKDEVVAQMENRGMFGARKRGGAA